VEILLIDGYNVVNRIQELKSSLDGGLENASLKNQGEDLAGWQVPGQKDSIRNRQGTAEEVWIVD
jgi:hypothetical protein